ncbi:MAG: hypothetical protein EOP20_01320 [Hyphomicrobiales bacterium]|nr:MAG: hypothetical protein EOP20_01320 [Hyphomicrobiales bacterium]
MAYAPTGDGFIANMPFTNVYGNGGLLTTIGDMLRWNAFLDDPSNLPGGEALVAALQTPGRLRNGTALEYSLGLELGRSHGQRLVAHGGSTAGYKAWLGRYPDRGISVAVLCNNGGINPVNLGEKVVAQALTASGHIDKAPASLASRPPVSPQRGFDTGLTSYQGLFWNPVTGSLLETKIVDGRLTLQQDPAQLLTQTGEERFQLADGSVAQFSRSRGKAVTLTLGANVSNSRYVAVGPARTGLDALLAYEGNYYSTELDTRISFVRAGDTLLMRQAFATEWQLAPVFADGFTTSLRGTTSFVFTRARNGQIDGFAAWANGARNIRFVREP